MDLLFEAVYGELVQMASGFMRGERVNHTLQTNALVHEVFLRLVDDRGITWQNRAHFFGVAARAMRQILVDYARRHRACKREGGLQKITLVEGLGMAATTDMDILDLEEALLRLGEMHERMAKVVELRVFGGMKVTEIAHALHLSRQTVHEDWRFARMWLSRELAEDGPA